MQDTYPKLERALVAHKAVLNLPQAAGIPQDRLETLKKTSSYLEACSDTVLANFFRDVLKQTCDFSGYSYP